MAGRATVIADASPLVALSLIERLEWLAALFGSVHVVSTVLQEVLTDRVHESERGIRSALDKGWLIPAEADANALSRLTPNQHAAWRMLDAGEADSIAYALGHSSSPLLLMDERAGRSLCSSLNFRVVGTAGLVLLAKGKGLVPRAKPELAKLHASGFCIAPSVLRILLQSAGEAV